MNKLTAIETSILTDLRRYSNKRKSNGVVPARLLDVYKWRHIQALLEKGCLRIIGGIENGKFVLAAEQA